MRKILFCFVLTVIFTGCKSTPMHINVANEIIHAYGSDLNKNQGLKLSGSGGRLRYDIKELSISLTGRQEVDIETARRMYVNNVELLLKFINSNDRARPYLHNYPFTIDNVELDIDFISDNNRFVNEPNIAHVFMYEGEIVYSIYNPIGERLEPFYYEPYLHALNIVRGKCNLSEQ